MGRRGWFLSALLALLAPLALAWGAGWNQEPAELRPITVLCVRHAEKEIDQGADSPLSEAGRKRALELAHLAGEAGVTHLIATEFARTRSTLAPLATRLGLEVETRPASDPSGTAKDILALPGGSVVVVAGHSNTVSALVRGLGGDPMTDVLADDEYDRLYVVTVPKEGCAVSTLLLRYGGA